LQIFVNQFFFAYTRSIFLIKSVVIIKDSINSAFLIILIVVFLLSWLLLLDVVDIGLEENVEEAEDEAGQHEHLDHLDVGGDRQAVRHADQPGHRQTQQKP
jgi:hypothetical protein